MGPWSLSVEVYLIENFYTRVRSCRGGDELGGQMVMDFEVRRPTRNDQPDHVLGALGLSSH